MTTHDEIEAHTDRRMVERARRVIVVCDSSKIGRAALSVICAAADVDVLITDAGAPSEDVAALRGRGHRGGDRLMRAGVLAIATSPAIDRISLARGGAAEGIVRASEALETPGGKAIHAAMVARGAGGGAPGWSPRSAGGAASCCASC